MSNDTPKMAIRTFSKPLTTQYDIMFDRDITSPEEWHEEFYVMRNAIEGDVVNVHINTHGGSVATISGFKTIKDKSDAHFHAVLEGVGYSAGSAFFLMCDSQEVGEFAEMMIHTSQGGFYSHSQGREDSGKQSARTAKILVESVYKDFLTEEEIADVLKGAEIWLDSSEIKERLEKRKAIREEREKIETLKSYNVETLAAQYLQDLLTDCQYLDYDTSDVVKSIVEQLDEIPKALQKGTFTIDLDEVEVTQDINLLKNIAEVIDVPFAKNIGIEKLRSRILDTLDNIEE